MKTVKSLTFVIETFTNAASKTLRNDFTIGPAP